MRWVMIVLGLILPFPALSIRAEDVYRDGVLYDDSSEPRPGRRSWAAYLEQYPNEERIWRGFPSRPSEESSEPVIRGPSPGDFMSHEETVHERIMRSYESNDH